MILNLGDKASGSTVYIPFHTFDSNDPSASVTMTGLAVTDIEIFKDGSATTRASDSGYSLLDTDGIDFASITGLHGISIDLADNSDAGFYAAGSEYWVAISSITVDGATINFWAAIFTIERAGGFATILTDTEAVLSDSEAVLTDSEAILADTEANVGVLTDTEAILSDTEAVLTDSEAILADTNELQGDWTDAGRLDAILDAVLVDTEAVIVDTEAILADTEANVGVLTDTEAILADTNELQADWTDAGRLDAILDAVLVDTEAVITDTEAVLVDSEAILVDSEAIDTVTAALTSAAAGKLASSATSIIEGTVSTTNTAASTTTFVSDDITEATADHYNGRIILFTSGDLVGQGTDITDYELDGNSEGAFTFTALTEAPGDDDTFVIV